MLDCERRRDRREASTFTTTWRQRAGGLGYASCCIRLWWFDVHNAVTMRILVPHILLARHRSPTIGLFFRPTIMIKAWSQGRMFFGVAQLDNNGHSCEDQRPTVKSVCVFVQSCSPTWRLSRIVLLIHGARFAMPKPGFTTTINHHFPDLATSHCSTASKFVSSFALIP